jgi:Dolichyl-phosphate-mannose-protein mannosyltransferase
VAINGRNRRPSAFGLLRRDKQTAATGKAWFLSGSAIVLYLALAKLLFHMATAGSYGIFRDELYYLACGEHFDWGYVDQPPLIALIAWVARHLFDHSLIGLRLIPAIAGAATVWLTRKLSREMGGSGFAQVLAALAVIATPIFIIMHHWLTMNAFEPLIWMSCVLCIVGAINRDDSSYWIGLGCSPVSTWKTNTRRVFSFWRWWLA